MYLIVGLGNPGREYEDTRHNVGYRVISYLAKEYDVGPTKTQKDGITATFSLRGEKVMLCEPLTYMNLSGKCVAALAHYYKIPDENIIVIYDDIDLPLGDVRVRAQGGPGTHNGMKSVVNSLGTRDFPRIRVGTGPVPEHRSLVDFVLSRFPKDEVPVIDEAAKTAAKAAILIIEDGVEKAMNDINKRVPKD